MKEGEDAIKMIQEALDMIGKHQPLRSSIVVKQEEHASGSIEHHHHNPSPSDASKPMANNDSISQNGSEKKEAQMPSELITSCVATWIMIQVMEKLLGSITHPKTESNCIVIVRH